MNNNRTINSSRNFIFGLIEKLVTILFPFITRTIIIYKLGNEYLGLSTLFTSILSILSLSELGIGNAIIYCLYEPVAKGDNKSINIYLGYIRRVYKFVGIFILSVGVCLIPFLKYLINGSYPADINLYYLYIIYLLNASVSYLFFAYKTSIYSAYQRSDKVHKAGIISEIIKYIIQIFVLVCFKNYYLFVIALLLSTFIKTLIIGISSKKDYPENKAVKERNSEAFNKIKSKATYIFASSVCSRIVNAVDNIVISSGIGVLALGIYGNYNYISSSILGFIMIAYQSLTSSIGNALIVEKEEKNKKIYKTTSFIFSWTITFCSICLICLYQPFVKIWVGETNMLPLTTVILVCLFFYANANTQMYSSTYVNAAGLWNKTLPYRIVASIVNLVLDIALIKPLGVNGVLIGSVVSYLFISLPAHVVIIYKYVLIDKPSKGIIKHIYNLLTTIIVCTIFFLLINKIQDGGILMFILKMALCIIIPNVLFILINRKKEEFIDCLSYIRKLLKK